MFYSAFMRVRGPLAGAAAAILAVGAASALAGSGVGDVFNLGQGNTVNAQSSLSGTVDGNPQLRVENASTHTTSYGVVGRMSSSAADETSAGIRGLNDGYGTGVLGENRLANANGFPVSGVRGLADVPGGRGVYGRGNFAGVDGFSDSGVAVNAESKTGDGVDAIHRGPGSRPAVLATTTSKDASATAVYARISSTAPGADSAAVRAENAGTGQFGFGVWASHAGAGTGVYASSVSGVGVYGSTSSGWAGKFAGPVHVIGYLKLKAINGGPPPNLDCDESSEAGRMVLRTDGTTNLYICRGAAGWIGK